MVLSWVLAFLLDAAACGLAGRRPSGSPAPRVHEAGGDAGDAAPAHRGDHRRPSGAGLAAWEVRSFGPQQIEDGLLQAAARRHLEERRGLPDPICWFVIGNLQLSKKR